MHQFFDKLLPDHAILLARQFCDCLRDRINDVIGFIGIDFVRRGCCWIFGEKIVDQLDDHAMEAGAFFIHSVSGHTLTSYEICTRKPGAGVVDDAQSG
jgi:hypothetical protein